MRVIVQRVAQAAVRVDGLERCRCGPGLLIFVGVAVGDTESDATRLAGRIARLRVFENSDGRFDRSLLDVRGDALVVSQFTLLADTTKGNRPSFSKAAAQEQAIPVYGHFCAALAALGVHVETGLFGASMEVSLVNDGPVTVVIDS